MCAAAPTLAINACEYIALCLPPSRKAQRARAVKLLNCMFKTTSLEAKIRRRKRCLAIQVIGESLGRTEKYVESIAFGSVAIQYSAFHNIELFVRSGAAAAYAA